MEQSVHNEPEPSIPSQLTPVTGGERNQLIDALRGFAIFGILLVNMAFFIWPIYRNFGYVNVPLANSPIDTVVEWAVRFIAEGKFYIIFSFLFGLGMTVQYDRCRATERHFPSFFAKRMMVLALIGAIHGFVIWSGDILLNYATLGFLLILFSKCRASTLFRWAMGFYAVFWVLIVLLAFNPNALNNPSNQNSFEEALAVYQNGTWLEMMKVRATEMKLMISSWAFALWPIFTSFLVGAWSWRKGLWLDTPENRIFLRKLAIIGLAIGVVTNGIHTVGRGLIWEGGHQVLAFAAWGLGQFCQGYAYMACLALLFYAGKCSGMFTALANVGRMALTNYLTHSIFFTLVFYGYGLGLHGRVSATGGLLLTIGLYFLQIPFSKWWLTRYRFGPAEWLWRSLVYGKPQPMKKETGSNPFQIADDGPVA